MRKKILSALLLGLFTVASTSTFVSCKDYDDDVKNLQDQITTNDTNLKKLVEDKIALVNAEIEKTNKAISDAEKACKAADEELQKQIDAANKAITDGDKATLDAAKKAVEDAMVTVSTTYATKAELEKAQQDLTAAYKKADEVLNGKIDAKVEELVLQDKALDDAVKKAQKRADDAYTFAESISNDLKANYATKKELSDAVTDLKTTIGDVKTELTGLINANTNKITALDTRLETAEGKITKAVGRITANESAISKLDSLTKVHTADLAKLNSRLPKVADSLKVLYGEVDVLKRSLNTVADTLSQNYRAAVNAAVAQLRNDVKDSLNPIRIDINDLGTRVTTEVGRLDSIIEKANDSIDVVAANLKAVDNRVVAIESRLAVISGDLSNLITSIIYNGQTKNVILYGDVAADVKFPTTENNLLEFKKDEILMAHNNGFIYATINPAQIDFEGTSVKVVNSQNKECSLVKLANAVAVTEKDPILTITRATGATKNLGNGLYKLDVTTAGVAAKGAFDGVQAFRAATDGTTTSYVAYALQTEYKAGDSTRTVTSHYDVAFKPTHAVNAELNDIDIHAVEPGIDVAGNAAYTMKFSNVTSGEMKIEIKNKKNVYAAYVELAAGQSDAIKKGTTLPKTVIADTDLDKNVPISITDDLINKPIKLHWYFLNYDGTIVEKTDEAVVFSTSVFGNITVEKTWTINSAANQVVDFKAELQKEIKATAGKIDGKVIAEDQRLGKFAELMGVASIDSIKKVLKSGAPTDSIAVNLKKKADNTDIDATTFTFNPALVNNVNGVTKVEQVVDVTTDKGLEVASIKYIVNVEDPSYLDALNLRIASAFNVIDKDADYAKNLTVAWAVANPVGSDQTTTAYTWDTRSFVISKFVDARHAANDNTTKLIYNELPNANKKTYVSLAGEDKAATATISCRYIRTYSGNGVVSENTNKVNLNGVDYKGAAPGDNDSVRFNMQQIINYYGIIKKTHDTFYFSVVSPVNYGIFKGEAKTINADVNNVGDGIAHLSNFVWEDYSNNLKKFDLSDRRITSIQCILVPDKDNNFGRVKVPEDGTDPIKVHRGTGVGSNNLSDATLTFNMIPGSATSDCVLEVKLIVKDQWGIQTTMNGTINVKTSHAGAKKH